MRQVLRMDTGGASRQCWQPTNGLMYNRSLGVRKLNTKCISAQQMLNDELKTLYGLIWEWFEKEYPVHMIIL